MSPCLPQARVWSIFWRSQIRKACFSSPVLYGIATNVLRNQGRSERRYAAVLKRMPTLDPTPDFAAQAVERLDDEQQMQQVLTVLAKLPQRERDVFALCAWMEVSYEDAAIALRIPVGTVRSRLSRARTHLQELDPGVGHNQGEDTTLQETRR
ncbi:MAG: RNA polymerase sigma factor [Gaiellaceae bacterium]